MISRWWLAFVALLFVNLDCYGLPTPAAGQVLEDTCALEQRIRRINAHLLIDDSPSACQEAFEVLELFSGQQPALEACIRAFATAGEEKYMLHTWQAYSKLFPCEAKANRQLQESMAWGVIFKGFDSQSPIARLGALIAAFGGEDAKSVELLAKGCKDSNSAIRSVAVKLCGQMQDASLQSCIMHMAQQEACWKVRQEAIRAIGTMRIKKAKAFLLALIADEKSSAEEKAIAIKSLIQLLDTISRQELLQLIRSQHFALRLMAAQAIGALRLNKDGDLLVGLSADYHPEVRAAALHAMGLLRCQQINSQDVSRIAINKLKDSSPEVSITAAWLLALDAPELAKEPFRFWLSYQEPSIRRMAAAALAACGEAAVPMLCQFFQQVEDPYVKMNLAMGLIQQQTNILAAGEVLYQGLAQQVERWMWQEEETPFKCLSPSCLRYEDDVAVDPEAVNQITRLEVLNLLAITQMPKSQEAIKNFLQQKKWGISGVAATLLLCEGDEAAVDVVRQLINESEAKVGLQAALVLSLWSKDEAMISILETHYYTSGREMKERILESLGRIGSGSSIPFLIERLQEPQQLLRIIAAGALLQCLYN